MTASPPSPQLPPFSGGAEPSAWPREGPLCLQDLTLVEGSGADREMLVPPQTRCYFGALLPEERVSPNLASVASLIRSWRARRDHRTLRLGRGTLFHGIPVMSSPSVLLCMVIKWSYLWRHCGLSVALAGGTGQLGGFEGQHAAVQLSYLERCAEASGLGTGLGLGLRARLQRLPEERTAGWRKQTEMKEWGACREGCSGGVQTQVLESELSS